MTLGLLAGSLFACGAPLPSAAPSGGIASAPVPSAGRANIRTDLDAMLDARDTIHPDGWHGMARAEWVAAADDVAARAGSMTRDEQLVELVRLAAMPSWNGRDGHTGIFPFTPADGTLLYPLRWWQFSDGLVITAARPPYEDLVGSRVEAIAGRPIDEIMQHVEPLAPRDNPSNLRAFGLLYLRVSNLLAGLGVIDEPGPTEFTLVDRDGDRRDVEIEPTAPLADDDWDSGLPHRLAATDAPWLRNQDTTLWWTFDEDSGTLFAQFNHVRGDATQVVSDLRKRAKQDDVERVVIDLRHNSGGDNGTLSPLELALRDPDIDRAGRLFAIIGRVTFSAAANFATDLEGATSVTFAGEAMGGSPNLYGDTRPVPLPVSGQTLYMATRYWERSTPGDPRLTIEPDIPVDLSSEDYIAGRDPVLEAILTAPTPSD
ncbi:MAG TPA: hypothetical protein VFU17_00320 [Candidatus Limnocylindrales bacterium]|nr:hypothetical protein [Candidatus Limnocylindrales bacterium]